MEKPAAIFKDLLHFSVWHNNKFLDNVPAVFPDDFILVAYVKTDSVGEVFRLTNHIDSEWFWNDEVVLKRKSRSTSVGDVIIDQWTGISHVVDGVGEKTTKDSAFYVKSNGLRVEVGAIG